MKVSVLLPVWNGAWCVERAITSILCQTLFDFELFICDDGSTDTSWEICERLQQQDSRIKLIRNFRNEGLAFTLNVLVANSSAELIAIQEQDDISMDSRLEKQVEAFENHADVGIVSGLAARVGDSREILGTAPEWLVTHGFYPSAAAEMVQGLFTRRIEVVHSACMFRRSILHTLSGPFDTLARCSIDRQFFLRLAQKWKFHGIKDILVHIYRGSRPTLTSDASLVSQEGHRCLELLWAEWKGQPEFHLTEAIYKEALDAEIHAAQERAALTQPQGS